MVEDPATQARLWRIREDGAGLAGRAPSGRPAWPGWEDAAVPPARLGEYLAGLDAAARRRVRDRCAEELPDGPFTVTVRALVAVGHA